MTEGERLSEAFRALVQSTPDALIEFAGNPIYALFLGALISFRIWRSQTKLAFQQMISEEKRHLYRAFIRQVDSAVFDTQSGVPYKEATEFRKLNGLSSEIELVANERLAELSKAVVSAVGDVFDKDYTRLVRCSDGTERQAMSRVFFELHTCIAAAKQDLRT